MRDRLKNDKGFTMIEIIAVLIILAIVSAVVISRGTSTDNFSNASEREILKSHLRYAQARALSDTVSWGIRFNSGSYSLYYDPEGDNTLSNLPGESSPTHTLKGATIVSEPASVFFDPWGSPGVLNLSITLSGNQTINITRNTGFIP